MEAIFSVQPHKSVAGLDLENRKKSKILLTFLGHSFIIYKVSR